MLPKLRHHAAQRTTQLIQRLNRMGIGFVAVARENRPARKTAIASCSLSRSVLMYAVRSI